MTGYPLLNVFWTMFELFLWILWFFLLFRIITDIFRSSDLSGWGKAGWLVLVILLPLIGVLVYLIVRGKSMDKRQAEDAQKADAAFRDYIRETAGTGGMDEADRTAPSAADQLTKLAQLKADGHLSEQEYERAKASVLQ